MSEEKTVVTRKTTPKASTTSKKTVAKKVVSRVASQTPSASEKPSVAESTGSAPARPRPLTPGQSASKPAPVKKVAATATSSTRSRGSSAARGTDTSTPASEKPAGGQSISLKLLANATPEERLHMIQEAAYYRAEKRNFAPGHEIDDWKDAEREIDELLTNAKRISGH